MPFATTDPVLERARLVSLHQDGPFSVAELARRFGLSRPTVYTVYTVYTWIERYRDGGTEALTERSHAPHSQSHQTPPEVEALIVEARRKHPTWGPRKLLPYLARCHPDIKRPAASTAGAIPKRHGLTQTRRRRRPAKHPGTTPLMTTAPNQVWTADYKGPFKTRDGLYCYPLTVCDAPSHYVLSCQGLSSVEQYAAFRQVERLFHD